jgi:hypothetical protein
MQVGGRSLAPEFAVDCEFRADGIRSEADGQPIRFRIVPSGGGDAGRFLSFGRAQR